MSGPSERGTASAESRLTAAAPGSTATTPTAAAKPSAPEPELPSTYLSWVSTDLGQAKYVTNSLPGLVASARKDVPESSLTELLPVATRAAERLDRALEDVSTAEEASRDWEKNVVIAGFPTAEPALAEIRRVDRSVEQAWQSARRLQIDLRRGAWLEAEGTNSSLKLQAEAQRLRENLEQARENLSLAKMAAYEIAARWAEARNVLAHGVALGETADLPGGDRRNAEASERAQRSAARALITVNSRLGEPTPPEVTKIAGEPAPFRQVHGRFREFLQRLRGDTAARG